jgi:hypothetical protein
MLVAFFAELPGSSLAAFEWKLLKAVASSVNTSKTCRNLVI